VNKPKILFFALNLAALATGSFSTIKNALAKTNEAHEPVVNSPSV